MNNKFTPLSADDPRLTAYALADFDPIQAETLERDLVDSPDARTSIEEIRAVAKELRRAFAHEAGRARSTLHQPQPQVSVPDRSSIIAPHFFGFALTAAAALVASFCCWFIWSAHNRSGVTDMAHGAETERAAPPQPGTAPVSPAISAFYDIVRSHTGWTTFNPAVSGLFNLDDAVQVTRLAYDTPARDASSTERALSDYAIRY
jgi:hypothetical protein